MKLKKETTKYLKLAGGGFNMKLKHILASSLLGVALFTFQPSFAQAQATDDLNEDLEITEEMDVEDETRQLIETENDNIDEENITNEEDPQKDSAENDIQENAIAEEIEIDEAIDEEFEEVDSEVNIEEDLIENEDEIDQSELDSDEETIESETGKEKPEVIENKTEVAEKVNKGKEKTNTKKEVKISSKSNQVNLTGEEVVQLKKDLTKLGFGKFPTKPSKVYGEVTAKVVKEFQKEYGLTVNGIANDDTLNKLDQVINNSLFIGDKNTRVRNLKKDLTQLGFGNFPKKPSNTYGKVTAGVVKDFQKYFNLRSSGIADTITLNKINELLNPPYRDGDRGLHIVELKKDLTSLGFGNFPKNPSLNYGPVTSKVVKDFQKEYGLKVNGIANKTTLDKLKQVLKNSLFIGDRNSEVRQMKKKLSLAGFGNFPKNPSNAYGKVTEAVVKDFQKSYGLRVSGVADEKTLEKLKEILTPPFKKGDKGRHITVLKKNLTALGFGNFPKNPSTSYGSVTANVVKDFQKFFGLKENGVVDAEAFTIISEGLHNPIKSPAVKQLKKHLTKLGFGNFPKNPSNAYGKVTKTVVKDFQKYFGITTTGTADHDTLKVLNENINTKYQNGVRGPHIVKMKKKLTELGFGNFPKNPSEAFGTVTENVVKDFQRAKGLVVNGMLDSVTLKELNRSKNSSEKTVKIFIDAGHGGHDPGASANGLREKDLTLDIAKEIERLLKQYKNVEIMMSRSSDQYLSLDERTKKANDWGADFFLSVHINAGGGTGIESYVHKSLPKDSVAIQNVVHDHIMDGLKKDKVRDRGKKNANFHVLRESQMSALLIEYMFIDTTADANKLKSTPFKNKLARLTAEGVAKAFGLKK